MIPVLLHERAALFHGCAEDFGRVVKRCDLILTDPPYGAHTHENLGKEKRGDGAKKRDELDFPPLTLEQVRFHASEFVRVCDGWILVFTDDRSVSWWGEAIEGAGGRWIRTGHWVKTNPMPQMSGDRPSAGTEPIVIAHAREGRMRWRGGGRAAVWRGPRERDEDTHHPTQKPRWLLQELAGLFAEAGALVADPFMGVGSTGVGVLAGERYGGSQTLLNTKRRKGEPPALAPETAPMPEGMSFVGIDGHRPYVDVAAERVRGALAGNTSLADFVLSA